MAIQTPIALNGNKTIPNQTATSVDTSSIEAGFLPITSQPLDSGGQAPERTDFNGMFYLSTDQRVFLQNGGVITYSADVVSSIGGYPQNAILGYIDEEGNFGFVKSLIDDNAYNFVETPSYINGQYWEYVNILASNVVTIADAQTITGQKTFETSISPILIAKLDNLNALTVPSSNTYNGIEFRDVNNTRIGRCELAVTSAGLVQNVLSVSRLVNGTMKYADIACRMGTDGSAYATAPASAVAGSILTTATISKAANGYVKLGNGIILQWGTFASGNYGATKTVTFPTAFTSSNYQVVLSSNYQQTAGDKGSSCAVTAKSTSNFTFRCGFQQTTATVYYVAIGY